MHPKVEIQHKSVKENPYRHTTHSFERVVSQFVSVSFHADLEKNQTKNVSQIVGQITDL
jgi:gamma-glutamyl:cysteine ligase YbdK (ATP-grasp superfamily)